MKRLKTLPALGFFSALPAALVLFAAAACATMPQKPEEFGPFVRRHAGESIPAAENKKNPRAELNFALLDVTAPGALQALVRQLLYDGRGSGEYARLIVRTWKRSYSETAAENPGYARDWSYEEKQNLVLAGSYAVITREIFTYEGGAHPNQGEDHFVITLDPPRQLRIADLITGTGMSRLNALADRELRRLSKEITGEPLPPGKPLSTGIFFNDAVPLSEDFYPDARGLTFQWDPYEIAPYAAGGIEICIPWQELAGLLSPEGNKLSGAFAVPPKR
ncbi:MAG: RsiV family protein [Treponema sp.]|jgi:hypothetical protein|nr:RsiV family protein [Treponema sp.]